MTPSRRLGHYGIWTYSVFVFFYLYLKNVSNKTFLLFFFYSTGMTPASWTLDKNSSFLESDEPVLQSTQRDVIFINWLLRMHTDANIFLFLGCFLESNQLELCPNH